MTFAAIGDFGEDNNNHSNVAAMMDSWSPDFILTLGDNRYGNNDYDEVIGRRYCDYLAGVQPGSFCSGGNSDTNRFFPSLGNHDYSDGDGLSEYLDYFDLPGGERYYDYVRGPVHFFVLDSGSSGSFSTAQTDWVRNGLQASESPWQIVYFHHAPYSSGQHGSDSGTQRDFAQWGADAVIAGHDHIYERISRDDISYFVNGLGGRSRYNIGSPIAGSQVRYRSEYGAMRITADASEMTFEFRAVDGNDGALIDSHTIYNWNQPTTTTTSGPTTTPVPTTTTTTGGPGASTTLERRIASSADDAEESTDDQDVYRTSSDLELVDDPTYHGDQIVGLRFRDLAIPPGSRIDRAYIRFQADESDSGATNLTIRAHDVASAPAFTSSDGNISNRSLTAAAGAWNAVSSWSRGAIYNTPDLSAVVQEVVDRNDWSSGGDIAFVISGTGERTAESYDGQASAAPLLHIEYSSNNSATTTTTTNTTTTSVPTTTTTSEPNTTATTTTTTTTASTTTNTSRPSSTGTVLRSIAASNDDAEESTDDQGVYRTSSDLELVDDPTYNGDQIVGLRFRNITIPAGASIDSAFVEFTARANDTGTTNLLIRAHDTGSAQAFGSSDGDMSNRPTTLAAVAWSNIEPWSRRQTYESPDLSSVVQEIVDREDWASGGAIAFIVSGSGERTAYSYDGRSGSAARLHIDYSYD